MPYKSGKMKGELTTTEIRKLIRAHNVLVSIKIPKGSKREDIMAIVKKAGYMVDHEKQALIPKVQMKRKPKVDMKSADKVLPKPKTKEEKAASKKSRDMKKKDKEDKIKAEGVKQGAAIQRVLAKKKVAPKAKTPAPKKTTPAPKAKDTPSKITKKVSLNDFLKNLEKISKAPRFIKIEDSMTDDEIIERFNNTNDWKRFDVPIQKRLGKLLGFKL